MALVLSSPAFLFHLREPMSDVPVAAWWLLSLAFAVRGSARGALGAGLSAAAALLTRPNLLPLVVPVGFAVIASGPGDSLLDFSRSNVCDGGLQAWYWSP